MGFEFIREKLEELVGPIESVEPVGGGCIANASRIESSTGLFFLKWGGAEVSKTFESEAAGLDALRAAGAPLKIPQVISLDAGNPGYLLMEWIEQGVRRAGFYEAFGRALARMHRHEGPAFGFEKDNFIGRSLQMNGWLDAWPAFFRDFRLQPQVTMARRTGIWQPAWDKDLEALYRRLPGLLPENPQRSILHGDLWGGNYLVAQSGEAALFDPACYYGHRETDLAMTELFGGFDARFYTAYREAWPLDPGYEERGEIYNLYHVINHLNLFGASYAGSVARILRRFA